MCIEQSSTTVIGSVVQLMQGIASPHVRSLDQAAPLPQDVLCNLNQATRLLQGALRQPWPDHSQTGPSDNLVGSFCVTGIVSAMLDLGFRTVDVHWALPLAFYFYQKLHLSQCFW